MYLIFVLSLEIRREHEFANTARHCRGNEMCENADSNVIHLRNATKTLNTKISRYLINLKFQMLEGIDNEDSHFILH